MLRRRGGNVLKRLTPSGGGRGGRRSAPNLHFVKDKHWNLKNKGKRKTSTNSTATSTITSTISITTTTVTTTTSTVTTTTTTTTTTATATTTAATTTLTKNKKKKKKKKKQEEEKKKKKKKQQRQQQQATATKTTMTIISHNDNEKMIVSTMRMMMVRTTATTTTNNNNNSNNNNNNNKNKKNENKNKNNNDNDNDNDSNNNEIYDDSFNGGKKCTFCGILWFCAVVFLCFSQIFSCFRMSSWTMSRACPRLASKPWFLPIPEPNALFSELSKRWALPEGSSRAQSWLVLCASRWLMAQLKTCASQACTYDHSRHWFATIDSSSCAWLRLCVNFRRCLRASASTSNLDPFNLMESR